MPTLKLFLILVAIASCKAYENYNKTHYIFLDEWGNIDTKFKDGRVMYSNCTNKAASVKSCTMVMEKSSLTNDSYTCDISLKSEHERGNVGKKMKLLGGLGGSKALFFWQENQKRRGHYNSYGILNMEDCKFDTVKFDRKAVNRKTVVTIYDDSFDVFYKDNVACGDKMCRVTFDADANTLNTIHGFVEGNLVDKDWILQPLYSDYPDKGYFYVRVEGNEGVLKNELTTAYYIVKNETQALLKRYDGKPDIKFATNNGVTTVCATYKKNNGYVDCTRYYPENNHLSTIKLSSNDNRNKKVLSIMNTADYGILVLYKTSKNNGDSYSHLTLAKFDVEGKILKVIAVKGYCPGLSTMLENEEGNYCVVKRCIKEPDNMWGEKEMNFNYQCFTDDDLLY